MRGRDNAGLVGGNGEVTRFSTIASSSDSLVDIATDWDKDFVDGGVSEVEFCTGAGIVLTASRVGDDLVGGGNALEWTNSKSAME